MVNWCGFWLYLLQNKTSEYQAINGPVNTFLSWKLFQPLSRLTYCVYLVHISYQTIRKSSLRTPVYISDIDMIPDFFSDVVISLLLAAILSLCVEAPIIILENHFLKGGKSKDNEAKSQQKTENGNNDIQVNIFSTEQENKEGPTTAVMEQCTDETTIKYQQKQDGLYSC
ncbi:hypothetical protein C0J52_07347 [Blattella germanica]|nr:hypothetical protein C0J52_07347 [Blattella germanica]